MKSSSKIFGFIVSLVAIILSIPSLALADTDSRKGADDMGRGMEEKVEQMEERTDDMMGSSTDEDSEDVDVKDMDEDEDMDYLLEGMMGDEHRSNVAEAVLKLVELAGKDKNIGEEISEIAKEEDESGERAVEAIKEVETRGKFKTFLFGTDYKNIGAIRSEMVRSENNINRLTKAKDRIIDPEVKAELDVQIAALQKANDDAEAFVKANESKFSIFGWLFKLFSN